MDVHHHFNPGLKDNDGNPWSVGMALEELDRNGITSAIGSLGPVVEPRGAERMRRVRGWNEWAARLCLDYPGRFGLFAALPVDDMDLTLAEIAHAYDVLGADGIGLSTNEGDVWLSDARHAPMFEELDRRAAVVFVHPASTSTCGPVSASYGGGLVSPPWIEFPVNTARAILGLLVSGVTRTYPRIRFIFAHGGGVMPVLLGRIAGFAGWAKVGPDRLRALFPDGIHAEFAKFHFECGQAYAPEAFALLRTVASPSGLLFGSDYSYFPISHARAEFAALDLDNMTRASIACGNAAKLFPRFTGVARAPAGTGATMSVEERT